MADEEKDEVESDIGGQEEVVAGPSKKGGLLSPLIVKILSIVASLIAMLIISFVVSMIVSRAIKPSGPAVSEIDGIGRQPVVHLEYMDLDTTFRQQLLDGKMIQLKVVLGYKSGEKKLQTELSQIKPELRDIVIRHLSRLKSEDFVDQEGASLDKLERDILTQINRIINEGKVEKIFFQEYTLM